MRKSLISILASSLIFLNGCNESENSKYSFVEKTESQRISTPANYEGKGIPLTIEQREHLKKYVDQSYRDIRK